VKILTGFSSLDLTSSNSVLTLRIPTERAMNMHQEATAVRVATNSNRI